MTRLPATLRCSESLLARQYQPQPSRPPADTVRGAETLPPLMLPEPAAGHPVCLRTGYSSAMQFGQGVQTSPCSPPRFPPRGLGKGVVPRHNGACEGNTESTIKQESISIEPPWPWGSLCPKHACLHGAPLPHTLLFHFSTQKGEVTAAQQPLRACEEHQRGLTSAPLSNSVCQVGSGHGWTL